MIAERYYIVLRVDKSGNTEYHTGRGNFDVSVALARRYGSLEDAKTVLDSFTGHWLHGYSYKITCLRFTLEDV